MREIRQLAATALGCGVRAAHRQGGGCVASAWRLDLEDGRRVFAKSVSGPSPFAAEALGLEHLRVPGGVRVPKVLHVDDGLLVLEWMDMGTPAPGFQSRFGEKLAVTHSREDTQFGFDLDHRIGATPQKNLPRVPQGPGAWAEFWWSHRLEPMIRRLPPDLARRFSPLEARVASLLAGTDESPRILHGDLWGGNTGATADGEPLMFDPAAYYGHREADLAMTRMFGGFDTRFMDAYRNAAPLRDGWSDRLDFYMLYHVLNHLLLFGDGYLPQAESLRKRFA